MHTSRLGGSSASADIAVAVMPCGLPPTQMVMTLTVEATRRIACLKATARSSALSLTGLQVPLLEPRDKGTVWLARHLTSR